jgi:hypothetical protein
MAWNWLAVYSTVGWALSGIPRLSASKIDLLAALAARR